MPRTDAQRRALAKYESKAYDKILLRIRADDESISRKAIQEAADKSGLTVNAFILEAIKDKIKA